MMKTDAVQPLTDKVVLVTGATRGIGAACAKAFIAAGASVSISGRDQQGLSAFAESLDAPGRVFAFVADATDAAAGARLVAATVERFGRLDAAVNNVGAIHRPAPLANVDPAEFDYAVAANLRSVYLSMRAEIPAMLDIGGGAIINITSTAAAKGVPGMAAFAAAKAGVVALTRTAALDYSRRNIRVNAIAPGLTLAGPILNAPPQAREQAASMVPMRRMGQPEEVAAAAVWLSSAAAAYVTGATLPVDGGYTAQ
jgi:NAD(P)-dependent dehydrogenase (short-subunit alcohol dehydrogenase family)